ncbi:MAG: glycosyltransferase family 4 protein [Bacteroidales bacterium]|nr:glycosyltransferase family 4 protein [Bacteroidales bacterium]
MKKQRIAKILVITILCLSTLMFLPWIYLTPIYYIMRYAIMAMTAVAFVLTFSLTRCLSIRFVRLLLLTIACMVLIFFIIPVRPSDISQLVIALITLTIGAGLDWNEREWANISYGYTLLMIAVTLCNSLYYAGGLYVPEHYMFDEGKNQVGAMVSIGATACFYFGMKMKEERTAFWVVTFLALLSIVLIRARSDCFALIACMLLITAKEADFHGKWSVKTVLTILGIILIGVIIYTGFIGDELHTFMHGGKSGSGIDDITTRRWERNQKGMDIIMHHHSMEELKNPMKIPFIHNYPLLRLARYSIFSLPLLLFYLYFGISTLIELFKSRKTEIKQVGWVVCCIPLIISFAEPNFPYGPGLVQMLAFLLLGFSLRPNDPPQSRPEAENANTVLHVCNDFTFSKVHSNLYRELDAQGVKQTVFVPLRKEAPEDNRFDGQNTTFVFAHILKRLHRLFFFHKIEKTVREIEKTVDLNQISCIHATTLFSDGMVARELHCKYGIPYIVAVRNCDVNAFLRYLPHLWWVHRAVMETTDKVIFITPNLQKRLLKHPTLYKMREQVSEKSIVIPNGINEFWLNNIQTENTAHPHHLLYAGNFTRNKNLPRLIHALQKLRTELPDLHLDVAGDGGNDQDRVLALMHRNADWITYHGKITDLEEMKTLYRANHIFAMPSKSETFGLVYLEAMTQGLSVLWTKGEAIDGMFPETIGESVNPLSESDITTKLRNLLTNSEHYKTLSPSTFDTFRWNAIAKQYVDLYSISNI